MDFAKMGAISATLIRARFAASIVGIPRESALVRLRPEYWQKTYPGEVSAIECDHKKYTRRRYMQLSVLYVRVFYFIFGYVTAD